MGGNNNCSFQNFGRMMQVKVVLGGLLSFCLAVLLFLARSGVLEVRKTEVISYGEIYSHDLYGSNPTAGSTTFMSKNKTIRGKRRDIFPSKDVLVRSVYYDDRRRDGHQNTSVFLVLVLKRIMDDKLIMGCKVGEKKAKHFDARLIGETRLWRVYPQYNVIDHEEVIVHCYDLPVKDGDEAFIYYKVQKNSSKEVFVRSERPLMFPKPRVKPTSVEGLKYNLSVLTCTKVYGNPLWLKEWLTYQKTIGVDHVHMIADESLFRAISNELAFFLESLITDGFLSVDFWIAWLNNGRQVWYHNQGLILEDCIYQFRGTYDYVYILDIDDFFNPRVPNEKKVHYYINRMCVKKKKKKVATCKFRWIEFFPDFYGMNKSVRIEDGNMTNQLINFSHMMQGNRKSVHKTNAMVDSATHYAYDIMKGYERIEFPMEVAYVAHIRRFNKPDKKTLINGPP